MRPLLRGHRIAAEADPRLGAAGCRLRGTLRRRLGRTLGNGLRRLLRCGLRSRRALGCGLRRLLRCGLRSCRALDRGLRGLLRRRLRSRLLRCRLRSLRCGLRCLRGRLPCGRSRCCHLVSSLSRDARALYAQHLLLIHLSAGYQHRSHFHYVAQLVTDFFHAIVHACAHHTARASSSRRIDAHAMHTDASRVDHVAMQSRTDVDASCYDARMSDYRMTTRVGACIHCGRATVQSCIGCERFVCEACVQQHDTTSAR